MAKKVQAMVKLQIPAGKATPAPPRRHCARSARRQHHGLRQGLQREDGQGRRPDHPGGRDDLLDLLYTFITKTPPASVLKKAANIAVGSAVPNKNKVGSVTMKQVEAIAVAMMPDLNCDSESAARTVAGNGEVDGPRCDWLAPARTHGIWRRRARSRTNPTRLRTRCRWCRRSFASSTRPWRCRSASASTPSMPTRWCAARWCCRTGSAS